VKAFGQTLVTDHSKAMDQASALASSMNVEVPTPPKVDAQQEYHARPAIPVAVRSVSLLLSLHELVCTIEALIKWGLQHGTQGIDG
jgi:Domain of unknown function (DUF4142)